MGQNREMAPDLKERDRENREAGPEPNTELGVSLQQAAAAELELRRRQRRQNFFESYYNDRVAFIHDCFDWDKLRPEKPADYQLEIAGRLDTSDRAAMMGPHGLGKTSLASWLVLHFALTRDGYRFWKCITTASVNRQLERYLWPEIHKWASLVRWQKVLRQPFCRDELLTLSLNLSTGAAFAVSSDDPSYIEGAHEDELFYVFDESKAIQDATFDAAEGAFSNAGLETGKIAKALVMSTPGDTMGRFHDIMVKKPGFEDWKPRHVSLTECIKANRVSSSWADARKRQWGVHDRRYINRVLGQFAPGSSDGIIPLPWIEAAFERWRQLEAQGALANLKPFAVGTDVADAGTDSTVNAVLVGLNGNPNIVSHLEVLPKDSAGLNLNKATGRLVRYARQSPGCVFVIDANGAGAHMPQRLEEIKEEKGLAFEVVPFVAQTKTERTDIAGEMKFRNIRSAAWWHLRELLDPQQQKEVALPPDEELKEELFIPKWRELSEGVIQLESKDDLRKGKRLGRSTNKADAVVQAFWAQIHDAEDDNGFFVI